MPPIKTAINDFTPDPRLIDERGPTKARMQIVGEDFDQSEIRGLPSGAVTLRDAPLERMEKRKTITAKQYNGLAKFRHHWFNSGMAGSISTLDPNHIFAADISNFSNMPKTEAQVFHRQRYRQGVQELGMVRSTIVERVVCREDSLESAGRSLTWTNKMQAIAAATQVLRGAADDLCEIWNVDI